MTRPPTQCSAPRDLRTRAGRRLEVLEQIRFYDGFSIFWVTNNHLRASVAEEMQKTGEIITDIETHGFPWIGARISKTTAVGSSAIVPPTRARPRCSEVAPNTGLPCERLQGHSDRHQSGYFTWAAADATATKETPAEAPRPCSLLGELPEAHPDRNRPLAGAKYRVFCWHGEDITVPFAERGENWRYRKWTGWRTVKSPRKIASSTYNDLGPSWTDNHEWKFPENSQAMRSPDESQNDNEK